MDVIEGHSPDAKTIDPAAPAQTETERLARFAIELELTDVPSPVVEKAKGHFLDGLGIALASTGFDFAGPILSGITALSGDGGNARVLGAGNFLPPVNAALANGTLIHGLDFDDTHVTGIYHASAPALAAALAAGEEMDASGSSLLAAFIVGLEIGCRMAVGAEGGLHDKGFHPTALAGTFAAAFVSGRLFGMGQEAMVSAASIAGSQAAGLLETGGSWLKRLHPGWAAHAGYSAATLAKHGFQGANSTLEGKHGFYMAHLGRLPSPALMPSAGLGETWQIEGIALKPYPCCHFIHGFVDSALYLRDQVDISEIVRIDCPLSARLTPLVGEPREARIRPRTSYEAMFSVPYTVALALAKGEVDLAAFHDLGVDDPQVLKLADITYVEEDPLSDFPQHFPGEVRLLLRDGRTIARRERTSRGTPEWPLCREDIEAKFMANATRVIPPERARSIAKAVWELDRFESARKLTELCAIAL